jgi:hypothetical protein
MERHNRILSGGVAKDGLATTEDAYRTNSHIVFCRNGLLKKPKLRQSKLEKDRLYIVNIIKT